MRILSLSLILAACGAVATAASTVASSSAYVAFRADLPAGAAYTLGARALHPTQFALGWREVVAKRDQLNAMTPEALTAYLQAKDVPVVIGPGGVPFLSDGHHTLRALLESTAADAPVYGHILANWSTLTPAEFWSRMEASNYAYLRDADGQPRPAADLPTDLLKMQRDPYRGLAWAVMEAGGFAERRGVFFQEFRWAEFFRSRVNWDEASDEDFDRALNEARALARTPAAQALPGARPLPLQPRVVTERTRHDTDDPAIWVNRADPARSLVIGTDKDTDGALYVFDLHGKEVQRVGGLKRPNNVDLATGFRLGGREVDVVVTTEREAQRLRVFTLPDMTCVDRGDLVVFDGDPQRAPMGIALYRRPRDGALFAIVGGKSGPREGYLAQYRLEDDGAGRVRMTLVRTFGTYSGKKEIEALAVDAELGYVYCSDEQVGVRKYAADPEAPDAGRELAFFGTEDFADDHEGISLYATAPGRGYLVISNQQDDSFNFYAREGTGGDPHAHRLLARVPVATVESDGSDVTNVELPGFPGGLFVAMSTDRTFQFYAWEDFARAAGLASAAVPASR
jgi:3-phytase